MGNRFAGRVGSSPTCFVLDGRRFRSQSDLNTCQARASPFSAAVVAKAAYHGFVTSGLTAGQNEQAVYDSILMKAVNVFGVPVENFIMLGAVFYLAPTDNAYKLPSFDPK